MQNVSGTANYLSARENSYYIIQQEQTKVG